ncbi:MAG: hypothetical protein NTV79_06710 [Candidatus Aureabacteria bacterium]|nr:hypothetical protein [Candidatus Auribacterota bacterium]
MEGTGGEKGYQKIRLSEIQPLARDVRLFLGEGQLKLGGMAAGFVEALAQGQPGVAGRGGGDLLLESGDERAGPGDLLPQGRQLFPEL